MNDHITRSDFDACLQTMRARVRATTAERRTDFVRFQLMRSVGVLLAAMGVWTAFQQHA